MARTQRHVVKVPNGWAVKAPRAERASSVLPTQQAAYGRARQIVHNAGGGEVVVHRPNGAIRNSNTIPPAVDPCPPRDIVH